MKQIALGLLAALALASSAHAASAPARPDAGPIAEKVACTWRHGVRVCSGPYAYRRHYRAWNYGPSYGYRAYGRPEDYPVGSTEWWRAKDRDCSGGYRC